MSRKSPATGGSPASGGSPARRKSLILKEPPKPRKRLAEIAGVKAAECFVVACCCPCSLVNILFLAVVKIPASLFRRAMRRRRRRRRKRTKKDGKPAAASPAAAEPPMTWPEKSPSAEVEEMEEKMWPEFFGTGFWRSPSQRELVINNR